MTIVPVEKTPRHVHLEAGLAQGAKALHEFFTVTDDLPDVAVRAAVPASLREGITGGLRAAPR